MNVTQAKLEVERAELLDVGLRYNALINYQLSNARGIEVFSECTADVYRVLVQDGKAMSFLPKSELSPQLKIDEDLDARANSVQNGGNQLQTFYPSTEFQKRLLNTRRDANTAMEELGVNTLYLALGMLQWYESESSNIPRKAPLILIPVYLSDARDYVRIAMRYTGEDIGTNLSLQEKLREFDIQFPSIPEVDDPDEIDIQAYFQKVENTICLKPQTQRWEVDRSAIVVEFSLL